MTYETTQLANGVRVVTAAVPAARSTVVTLLVGAGSRYERAADAGVAHLTEHAVFKGSASLPTPASVAEALDRLGGQANAFTSKELTGYWAHCLPERAPRAFEILADLVASPVLDATELGVERDVVLEELAATVASPERLVQVLWENHLFGDSPLGRPVLGYADTIAGLGVQSVRAFHERHYTGANVVVGVAGAIPPRLDVERLLGALPAGESAAFAPASSGEPGSAALEQDGDQVHVLAGAPGLRVGAAERYVLSVLDAVLTGGMSGRAVAALRERRGLAYTVAGVRNDYLDTGSYAIHAVVSPANAPATVELVLDELERLRAETIPEHELRRARDLVASEYAISLEQTFTLLRFGLFDTLLEGRAREPEEISAGIGAVTARDVRELAQRLFEPGALRVATVGPAAVPAIA